MKHLYTLLFSMLLINSALLAQPDGTVPSKKFRQAVVKNLKSERSLNFDIAAPNLSVTLPIAVHIVNNKLGSANIDLLSITGAISTANGFFLPLKISFSIGSIETVTDYNYSAINKNDRNMIELIRKHAEPNKINLYLLEEIKIDSLPVYGFTYYPSEADSNYIFLQKSSCNGSALATMLGHYFGLLSTHDAPNGAELADESNCADAGDLICDTYADPNLYNQVDPACIYKGAMKDFKGNDYVPSVANIMSNSPDACKCKFTAEQYRRMYFYFLKYRQFLKD